MMPALLLQVLLLDCVPLLLLSIQVWCDQITRVDTGNVRVDQILRRQLVPDVEPPDGAHRLEGAFDRDLTLVLTRGEFVDISQVDLLIVGSLQVHVHSFDRKD